MKIEREDIHIIGQHSNLSPKGVNQLLKDHVYNGKTAWQKFLRLFFFSVGIGFTTAGIIFFFAYNWADLHKFVKIGLIEGLIIITISIVLFSKLSIDIKNIVLTGASILVGVLFAVFGQIYQTGANAYDFFLGWTMFVALWVLISNFAPLWLLFIVLINTTFILYWQQVANDWSEVFVFMMLFIINTLFLVVSQYSHHIKGGMKSPIWFSNLLALTAVCYATFGMTMGIFREKEITFFILLAITALLYTLGIKFGLKVKSGFYLSIIPFSIIIIIAVFLVELSEDAAMFFFISLFVIASVTLVIKNLINLQKKWTN